MVMAFPFISLGDKTLLATSALLILTRYLRPNSERQDSNLRPSVYETDELPDCSTPRRINLYTLTRI